MHPYSDFAKEMRRADAIDRANTRLQRLEFESLLDDDPVTPEVKRGKTKNKAALKTPCKPNKCLRCERRLGKKQEKYCSRSCIAIDNLEKRINPNMKSIKRAREKTRLENQGMKYRDRRGDRLTKKCQNPDCNDMFQIIQKRDLRKKYCCKKCAATKSKMNLPYYKKQLDKIG